MDAHPVLAHYMYNYNEFVDGVKKPHYVFYDGTSLTAVRLESPFHGQSNLFFGLPCVLGSQTGTTWLGKRKDHSSPVTDTFRIALKEDHPNLPLLKGTLSACEDSRKYTFTANPASLPELRSFKINLEAGSFTKVGLGIGSSVTLSVSTRPVNAGRRVLVVEKIHLALDDQKRSPYDFHIPDPALTALRDTLKFALAIGPRDSLVVPVISQDDFFRLKIHPTTPCKIIFDFAVSKYLKLSEDEKDDTRKGVWKSFHTRLVRKLDKGTAHALFIPGMFPELSTHLCEFLAANSFFQRSKAQKAFLLVTLDPLTDEKNHVELNFPLVGPATSASFRLIDSEINLSLLSDDDGRSISTTAKFDINLISNSGSDLSRTVPATPLPLKGYVPVFGDNDSVLEDHWGVRVTTTQSTAQKIDFFKFLPLLWRYCLSLQGHLGALR